MDWRRCYTHGRTGLVTGFVLIAFGMTPAELIIYLWRTQPLWLQSGWTRLIVLIVGLVIIAASLRFNVWSRRQQAIDELSIKMQEAVLKFIGKVPKNAADWPAYNDALKTDIGKWRGEVSKKLENRAFFTKSDQLHFDVLGHYGGHSFVGGNADYNTIHSELLERMQRLRDVINWCQQRVR